MKAQNIKGYIKNQRVTTNTHIKTGIVSLSLFELLIIVKNYY